MHNDMKAMRITLPHIRTADVDEIPERNTTGREAACSSADKTSENASMLKIPSEPIALSYWVAQNLPLVDAQRSNLLEINSSIQRLRWELSFLEKVITVLFIAWLVQCGNELHVTPPLCFSLDALFVPYLDLL
jgi:hypothetical protein